MVGDVTHLGEIGIFLLSESGKFQSASTDVLLDITTVEETLSAHPACYFRRVKNYLLSSMFNDLCLKKNMVSKISS